MYIRPREMSSLYPTKAYLHMHVGYDYPIHELTEYHNKERTVFSIYTRQ